MDGLEHQTYLARWIDAVAAAIVAPFVVPRASVQVTEEDNGRS
jgi:hypothetical protein